MKVDSKENSQDSYGQISGCKDLNKGSSDGIKSEGTDLKKIFLINLHN